MAKAIGWMVAGPNPAFSPPKIPGYLEPRARRPPPTPFSVQRQCGNWEDACLLIFHSWGPPFVPIAVYPPPPATVGIKHCLTASDFTFSWLPGLQRAGRVLWIIESFCFLARGDGPQSWLHVFYWKTPADRMTPLVHLAARFRPRA